MKFSYNKLAGTSTEDPTTGLPYGINGKDFAGIGGSKLAWKKVLKKIIFNFINCN